MTKPMAGKVCLVTGATRGIGRGIALQLGQAGAIVYITGRTLKRPAGAEVGGSLEDTAAEIESRGGVCIPVQCDHSRDTEVAAVFDRIKREQDGQLDLLVNNSYAAVLAISKAAGVPFWEQRDDMWDVVNNVGLRNHYMCTIHAARIMVPRRQGLIVNVSSMGGLRYLFNVSYGIGKAAVDRMAADCAVELRKHNVSMISLWPGPVKTEMIDYMFGSDKDPVSESGDKLRGREQMKKVFANCESTEFAGKCIVKLAEDTNLKQKSGRILMTSELGREYGVTDIDGRSIPSSRSLSLLLTASGWTKTAAFVPSWIKVPYFMVTLYGSKF